MDQSNRPLLDALLQRGADSRAIQDAADEAERASRSIRDVLINDRVVSEMELTEASAEVYGINSVDLVGYPIDAAALKKIPLTLMLRHRLFGIGITDDELVVAVSDPDDVVALDDARAAAGMTIRPVVAARSELRKVLDRLKREESDLGDMAASLPTDELDAVSNISVIGDDAPIVRYVNSLIEQAILNRASDLHLEPTEHDMRVRYRIDGVLHEVDTVPHAVQSALVSQLKIMSNVDITERRVPQNGRITVRLDQHAVDDVRVQHHEREHPGRPDPSQFGVRHAVHGRRSGPPRSAARSVCEPAPTPQPRARSSTTTRTSRSVCRRR